MSYDDTDNDDSPEPTKKEWKIIDKMAELKEQLAASQARAERYRTALQRISDARQDELDCERDSIVLGRAIKVATQALTATPEEGGKKG